MIKIKKNSRKKFDFLPYGVDSRLGGVHVPRVVNPLVRRPTTQKTIHFKIYIKYYRAPPLGS